MKRTDKPSMAGILGWPLGHTLSPAMHNAGFRSLGIPCVYLPFPVDAAHLRDAVKGIRTLGFIGVNVTVPHKKAVIPFLDRTDAMARRIGSVNTIVNARGKLTGYNTDAEGFLRDLSDGGFSPRGKIAMVLGAGGAARAVVYALHGAGVKKVLVVNRNENRGRRLAKTVRSGVFVPRKEIARRLPEADLLVNATSLGLQAGDPSPVAGIGLPRGLFAYDLVYHRTTRFMAQAKKSGCTVRGGLGMLLHQGTRAFELMTGMKAPVEVMKKALLKALAAT